MDAGANAPALPVLSVASLVGFGSVVASLPAFAGGARLGPVDRRWSSGFAGGGDKCACRSDRFGIGGLTIALDALAENYYMRIASEQGIDPGLMHRVAVIGAGTLDSLPHNGAVVTLLAVCGSTHRESYFDIVMVSIVGGLLALAAVIGLGRAFGSF
jgi:H+/gluconate symporter-like permease